MTQPGKIEIVEAPKPKIERDDQVMLRMKRIGVCGSDIHVYHGSHPYTKYPIVQGHEVSGVVEEVGSRVRHLKPGDKATIMPQIVCGECYYCKRGMYHICESLKVRGFQANGAAQDHYVMEADMVLRLPDEMSLDAGAMIEPVSVAVHAVKRLESVDGGKILVLGAGTIGNLTAQVTKALGAASVMITDISDYKLEKARACGVDCVVNTAREDLGAALARQFGPERADAVFECVGSQTTIDQAIQFARKASTIVLVGVYGKKPTVDLSLAGDRELRLLGSLMYRRPDFETAIHLISEGKLKLEPMITHRFAFPDFLKAYETIEEAKGNSLKVMIEL
jgi:L-iditol 2-dehydrogenase